MSLPPKPRKLKKREKDKDWMYQQIVKLPNGQPLSIMVYNIDIPHERIAGLPLPADSTLFLRCIDWIDAYMAAKKVD